MLGSLDVFHVGVVVDDLDVAMQDIGTQLGIRWSPVQERTIHLRTVDGETRSEDLRFTYSSDGPPHVELIQSPPGSVWRTTTDYGLHHLGCFAPDISVPPGPGMTLEFGGGHAEVPEGFAYYVAPGGIRVELVRGDRRPEFDRWFAGGDFG